MPSLQDMYGYSSGQQDLNDPNNTPNMNWGDTTFNGGTYNVSGSSVEPDWGFLGEDTSSQVNNGGSDWGSLGNFGNFLGNIGNSLTNGVGLGDNAGLAGALAGPAFITAAKQYNDAGQYKQLGQEAAQVANPFGPQRAQYQTMLSNVYNDPTGVLNNPSHVAVQTKQMNAIDARNRAGGYMGSGKASTDLADYQAQSDAQYLDQEKQRLAELSGAQFNPASAGQFLMQGGQQAIDSQNMALGTMMSPYLAYIQSQYAGNRAGPNGTGNTGAGGTSGLGGITGAANTAAGMVRNAAGQLVPSNISGIGVPGYGGGQGGYPNYPTQGPQGQIKESFYDENGDLVDSSGNIVATRGPDGEYYVPSYPTTGDITYGGSGYDTGTDYGLQSDWDMGPQLPSDDWNFGGFDMGNFFDP